MYVVSTGRERKRERDKNSATDGRTGPVVTLRVMCLQCLIWFGLVGLVWFGCVLSNPDNESRARFGKYGLSNNKQFSGGPVWTVICQDGVKQALDWCESLWPAEEGGECRRIEE